MGSFLSHIFSPLSPFLWCPILPFSPFSLFSSFFFYFSFPCSSPFSLALFPSSFFRAASLAKPQTKPAASSTSLTIKFLLLPIPNAVLMALPPPTSPLPILAISGSASSTQALLPLVAETEYPEKKPNIVLCCCCSLLMILTKLWTVLVDSFNRSDMYFGLVLSSEMACIVGWF
ncbi:hypothetical protein I3843_09G020300 [Carya illinoinensis]|uniref:Uncharacterized protein n=1 Tax=Carya illinoinensis TaxID=32201 RepID=A0A922DZF2_CARIL|nr:hypothetical protein I3842_09G020300 [Carya illinoinensis]KAG7961500.1 hypothetical protein I3843_09G020300 [Carya illinoinensis]